MFFQENGCVGHAKCMKKSSAQRALRSPRSGHLAGRCRVGSCRKAPKLSNVPSALSSRGPSGALLMAKPGFMRYAGTPARQKLFFDSMQGSQCEGLVSVRMYGRQIQTSCGHNI